MTRVLVVADSGSVLANLTAAVAHVPGAYVVRHGSSMARLDRLAAQMAPDLVVMGDLMVPDNALARLSELAAGAPGAQVVVVSASPEAAWLADALRAHAAAVVPGNVGAETLGVVLREVLETRPAVVHALPVRTADLPLAAGAAA
jgi:DNA-binding NarL/FixJ family response regulator